MRIIGLGVDLAEIDRVRRLLVRYEQFPERCFTENEREYAFGFARPERRLAARFAGKEEPGPGVAQHQVEGRRNNRGRPASGGAAGHGEGSGRRARRYRGARDGDAYRRLGVGDGGGSGGVIRRQNAECRMQR